MYKKACFLFVLIVTTVMAKSQTADEIISKYIAFTGGVQKWKSITSIVSTGTYNYNGIVFPFKASSKAPNLYEYTVTAHGKSFMQGYNGTVGWRIDGFKNETKKTILKGKKAFAIANESDVELESPFINYKQKGHTITLVGTDSADKKPCYKIKLTRKNGDVETYFFDKSDFALIKKQAVSKNTEMENAMLDIIYSDYKNEEGINTAHKIAYTTNGQDVLIITVEHIALNIAIPNSSFQP
ncbi:MAG: hypothetical protein QM802_14240 [Agriterribacter sp.]